MTLNSVVALSPTSSTSSSATGSRGGAVVNASRLRENQRRSRARKKEYLSSLEARFQACQRTGVEANVEIQVAAKRVVRENKLLRAMLNRRGVTDAEINKTLKEGGEKSDEGEGESAVDEVLKVLGKRPCGGEPTTGGAAMQCKPFRTCEGQQRTANERCNSTGMVATRGAERGGGRRAVNGGAPTLAVATSRLSPPPSQPPHQHAPSNYPTPTSTPTTTFVSKHPISTSAPQLNDFYNYNISPTQSQSSYMTSPTISSPSPPSYNSYLMTPAAPTLTSNSSCCPQPQNSFYPTSQPQCAPLRTVPSSMPSCCPPQRALYSTALPATSCSSSYQAASAASTTPCHLAQSFINQLHPGLQDENASSLIDEICPPGMMQSGQCHVDNAVLFGVLDRI